jgi:hypothetical protein
MFALMLVCGMLLGIFLNGCRNVNMVTIIEPKARTEINATRATLKINVSPQADRSTFKVILNEKDITNLCVFNMNTAFAWDVPLVPGTNTLLASAGMKAGGFFTGRDEVTFKAGPEPVTVKGAYIYDTPMDISAMRNFDNLLSLRFYLDIKSQSGFFFKGNAKLVQVNDHLLTEELHGGFDVSGEVLGDQLKMDLVNFAMPLEDLFYFIIDPLEEYLGEDLTLPEIPLLKISVVGQAKSSTGTSKIDILDGNIELLLLADKYEVPVGGSFLANKYVQQFSMGGDYTFESGMSFKDQSGNDRGIRFTFFSELSQSAVDLTGTVRFIKVNDLLFSHIPDERAVAGMTVYDQIALNFKSFDLTKIPALAEYLTGLGIVLENFPTLDLILRGTITGQNKKPELIDGDISAGIYGGLISTPGIGHFTGKLHAPDSFKGPRIFNAVIDPEMLNLKNPINMSFCMDVNRNGIEMTGNSTIMTLADRSINIALQDIPVPSESIPSGTVTTNGVIVSPDMAINWLSYAIDNQEFLAMIKETLEAAVQNKIDIPMPDSLPIFDITLRGQIGEENNASGGVNGTLLGLFPIMDIGNFNAPNISAILNKRPIKTDLTIALSELPRGTFDDVHLSFDLTLSQNGCEVTGSAKITNINGRDIPERYDTKVHPVVGMTDGENIRITLYDLPVQDYIEQDIGVSGPLFDISLVGKISKSNANVSINGDLKAGFAYEILTFALGSFSAAQ